VLLARDGAAAVRVRPDDAAWALSLRALAGVGDEGAGAGALAALRALAVRLRRDLAPALDEGAQACEPAAWHYTLDEPGARLVAARQEIDFADFTFKKARIFDVVGSPRLRHRVECNGFFARLTFACRGRGWKLEWTGERRATARWYEHVTPDGIGRIVAGDRGISFFLEYDRGTENHDQLERKIDRYRVVARAASLPDALLFVFPSPARERQARRALVGAGFTVATAVRHHGLRDPLGPVWLPLHDDRRVPILDLPLEPRDDPG
jgi:hypothetical protein